MSRSRSSLLAGLALGLLLAVSARPDAAMAVPQCGGQKDSCNCGANNPYPCCDNGSNCTWWSWHRACCKWGVALPGWGNANTWASYAKGNSKYEVVSSPVVGSIATSTKGTYGHVAWVESVNGGQITVSEMNCCGSCKWGMGTKSYAASYFNSGYVIRKGSNGPVCGNGKCEGGENCSNCGKDCGACCGNGKCDNGENCKSCGKDCGACCGNGKCDNGENCKSCSKDCGSCCGNGKCDNGENCKSCSKDCGSCCGNGKCDNGESCASCSKDCGSCCGNGKCDNGENCSTCSKDCGDCCGNGTCDYGETCPTCSKDCHCAPIGGIDEASCKQIRGWASDPDATVAVQIELRVDGKVMHKGKADGAHAKHGGHGFSWPVAAAFKKGAPHKGQVTVFDTQTDGKVSLGELPFLCDNRTTYQGIWVTQLTDASGVKVTLPEHAPPHLALRHGHQAGDPYPVSGVVESCATVAQAPFEGLRGLSSWQLKAGHQEARLTVNGKQVHAFAAGSQGKAKEEFDGPVSEICLRTEAKDAKVVGDAANVDLSDLRLLGGGWTSSYEVATEGLIFAPPQDDSLIFASRGQAGGMVNASGWIGSWRSFAGPFDTVTWQPGGELKAHLELVVDGVPYPADGSGVMKGLRGSELAFRLRPKEPVELPAGAVARIEHIRIRDTSTRAEGAWRLARQGSRGLSGAIPAEADDKRAGLHVALRHQPHDYWSTGALLASVHEVGPFERVRGTYLQQAEVASLRSELLIDGAVVAGWAQHGRLEVPFDVVGAGQQLGFRLNVAKDGRLAEAATFEVRDLQWLRGGWWSASSPRCAGLRDRRSGGDTVVLEVSQAWVAQKMALGGAHRVVREFAEPQTGIAFKYSQDLDEAALRVMVLLDGVPARLIEYDGVATTEIEVTDAPFKRVAFALAPRSPGLPVPRAGFAEFSDVRVRAQAGQWQPVASVPGPESVTVTTVVADGGAVDAGSTGDGGGGSPSAGCAATPAVPGGPHGAAPWLLALVAALYGLRRRSGRVSPARR